MNQHPNKRARTENYSQVTVQVQKNDNFPYARIVTDPGRIKELKDKILKILETNRNDLPGPLPFTLLRGNMDPILNNPYVACEKSDGQRVMVLVNKDGIHLIDRSFNFYHVGDPDNVLPKLSPTADTLLDGEIVTNYFDHTIDLQHRSVKSLVAQYQNFDTFKKARSKTSVVLCLFDIIMFNGEDLKELPFDNRCSAFSKFAKHYAKTTTNCRIPFTVIPKTFVNHYRCNLVSSMIAEIGKGDFLFFHPQNGILSLNDGIIFTPKMNNYLHNKDPSQPIFKYKWSGLHTIDFLIKKPFFNQQGRLQLFVDSNPINLKSVCTVLFQNAKISDETRKRVETLAQSSEQLVVECAYDTKSGEWLVKHERLDKSKSNFITTAISSFEAMADGLEISELHKMLLKAFNKN